jgi:protein-tyrosine kinase
MEQIKRAVERAKADPTGKRLQPATVLGGQIASPQNGMPAPQGATPDVEPIANRADSAKPYKSITLDWSRLERNRIVAHNVADVRSKAFDVLRTQVLQVMDQRQWTFLAVTSPTEGCGKSVTAINLALSIARQRERSALLMDLDLQRPALAKYLGLKCEQGMHAILEGRTTLADATIRARTDSCEISVIPAEAPTMHSSELIASRKMGELLQDIKRTFASQTVICDMPPLLQGDEVLSMLPRIDAILLVTAVGITTVRQIKECYGHLQGTDVIRLVLNKSHETITKHYY